MDAQGVPVGECTFTTCAYRALGLQKPAAKHILALEGPTLQHAGTYTIPAGQRRLFHPLLLNM